MTRAATIRAVIATAAFAMLAVLATATAAAEPVPVKVVDAAGGAVYVAPGRAAGVVPGTAIRLRGADLVVVEATEKTAMLRVEGARIAIGDTGTADVTRSAGSAASSSRSSTRRAAGPRAADAPGNAWREPVLPSTQQTPRSVPLSAARATTGVRARVIGRSFATTGDGGSTGDGELRVIAAFDALPARGLTADVDIAARWFGDGYDRRTRTPLLVRAAELRYAPSDTARLAAGRLPFAAAWLGMLDGARASARLGSLELAAFGGIVPDPLSGKPDASAARFGGEIGYDAPDAAWQPRVAVAVHGSTWNGALDERRVSLTGSASRGALWFDGWADAQAFATDNPWGASAVELTGAGAGADWHARGSHAGIQASFLRPERSLRLAAALPPEWLCTFAPRAGAADACAGGDWWGSIAITGGTATPRWAIDGALMLADSHRQYAGFDRSGYLRGELRTGPARLIAGISGGTASFASWTAGEIGAAYAPRHAIDLALTYRPEALDYAASTELQIVHAAIADARLAASDAVDVAASAIATTGGDRDALALIVTLVWRPLP